MAASSMVDSHTGNNKCCRRYTVDNFDKAAGFPEWLGLIQRTTIVSFMIWLFIFALGLLRQSKQG